MYKTIFLGILEPEKSQTQKSASRIMKTMNELMESMIFYVHFAFCNFSASKMPKIGS